MNTNSASGIPQSQEDGARAPRTQREVYEWDEACPHLGVRLADGRPPRFVVRWRAGTGEQLVPLGAEGIELTRESARDFVRKLVASWGPAEPPSGTERFIRARAACPRSIGLDAFYRQVRELNIDFGASFRALTQIWKGHYEAIGKVELDAALPADQDPYLLHPVFLDACLQVFGATLYEDRHRKTFIPVGMESFRFSRKPLRVAWSHVKLRVPVQGADTATIADIEFFDEAWQYIGGITGFSLLLGDEHSFSETDDEAIRRALYEVTWQQSEPAQGGELAPSAQKQAWLLLSDQATTASELALELQHRGHVVETLLLESPVEKASPGEQDTVSAAVREQHRRHGARFAGVIHVYPGEAEVAEPGLDTLVRRQRLALGAVLRSSQALLELESATRLQLWLVTHSAQCVSGSDRVEVTHAPLWGFGRVLAREQPSLVCRCLDVDVRATDSLARLVDLELSRPGAEEQAAWRDGVRYVPRMRAQEETSTLPPLPDLPFRLGIREYGSFDQLELRPLQREEPGPGEVELAVRATGLNFKDVLHALGMLNVDGQQSGVDSVEQMLFGGDCAGEVLRVGSGVNHLRPGDRVAAIMAFGCLGSHVNVPARFVVPLPPEVGYVEGATLPTAFLTACYALITCAGLKPGERVLIHAGAGGVGMAAIQVALMCGARVLATCSPAKQPLLRELGVEKVMNSRTLDFAGELTPVAEQGVDVVLNCLSGDFIRKSFEVLREGGRFVEIGKIGILSPEQARELRPDARYFAFDLMEVATHEPERMTELLGELIRWMGEGRLKPLPAQEFPMQRVAEAFRHMAQARHTGKIVITQERSEAPAARGIRFSADRTYLITGGLGSLGLDLAGWLARRGARHLVLMSRREPQEAAQRALAALREQGVEVRVHSADVSAPEEVRRLVELLDSSPAPLAGIFHAAGVLADATLPNQDWERFETVLRPKILGAWNLHLATKNLPLEHFVCFSSIASVLGSPGQSNYGAANAFLDALAHHRRAQGLPALSVNWGPWSGTGMTSQLGQQTLSRHAAGGVMMIDRLEGLHALEHLMLHGSGQALVFPVDWERFLTAFPGGEVPPFYQHIQEALHARPAEQEGQNLLAELREAAPRARRAMMVEAIKSLVGAVLRAPPDTLDEQQALREMGIDSLMGVELRNRLERRLELSIPASLLLQGPSIAEFAQATLGLLSLREDGEEASTSTARPSWFHVHGKAAEPDIRLFCFHHLGGGASVFRSWSDELPANVQVVAVQLPGREERTQEAALTRFDELLEQLVPQLHPLMDRRFSFFGHSMGTLVAFELARALRKRYGLQPERLFVSGLWAPTDHHLKKDRDYLAENDFRNLEISPSLRDDAAFMQGLMELMKHDAELLRSYRWQEEEPLSVPILSLSGSDDPIASAQEVQRWKLCTSGTLQHHVLPGKHMFIVESQKALLKLLAAELVAWSRHRGEWR